jgi:amino acid transporter
MSYPSLPPSRCLLRRSPLTHPVRSFPFLGILYEATASKGGSVAILFFLSVVTASSATISILATSGRVIWAFALEGGLPCSRFFSHVSPRFNVPVRALAASAIIQCLMVLLYIVSFPFVQPGTLRAFLLTLTLYFLLLQGNSALFNSLLQLAIALLNMSYALPIALMLFRGRPSGQLEKPYFSLGPVLGPIANVVALSYEVSFLALSPYISALTVCFLLTTFFPFLSFLLSLSGLHFLLPLLPQRPPRHRRQHECVSLSLSLRSSFPLRAEHRKQYTQPDFLSFPCRLRLRHRRLHSPRRRRLLVLRREDEACPS